VVDSVAGDNHRFAFERTRFFESSDDLMCILDLNGRLGDINPAWARIAGLTPAELLGHPLIERVHPDDAEEAQRTIDEVVATSDTARLVTRFRYANDEYHNLAWTLSEDRGVVFGTAREVVSEGTAQAQSVEVHDSYQLLFAENLMVMMLIDPFDGAILEANEAAVVFYGYSRAELLGMRTTQINTAPTDVVVAGMASVAAGNPAVFQFGHRLADGSIRDVEISANSVLRGDKKVLHTIIRDVTERKDADKALAALTKELERSNEELQQFAYIASHDLQEPLRTISSYTELLRKRYQGELDADADVFIGFVVDGAKRMKRLLEDLLKYSRVDSHRGPMKLVDSGDIVRFALANLTIAIRDSDAEVSLGDLPLVLADESQLMQLFQNLIGNALKFHNPGAVPHVYVGAVHQDHQWLFSVEDDGIGIGGEYFDAVFDVFRRLHTAQAYAGTGIGLAVCKRIVERHGGTIWVEPNEVGGSSFRFTLPIPS